MIRFSHHSAVGTYLSTMNGDTFFWQNRVNYVLKLNLFIHFLILWKERVSILFYALLLCIKSDFETREILYCTVPYCFVLYWTVFRRKSRFFSNIAKICCFFTMMSQHLHFYFSSSMFFGAKRKLSQRKFWLLIIYIRKFGSASNFHVWISQWFSFILEREASESQRDAWYTYIYI